MLSTTLTRETGQNGGELSEDEVFEILSNRRRRFVIHALKRAEGPIEVSELSTHVTAWEHDIDPTDVKYEDRRNVYSTLQRTHLPKLEEVNVVTVDDEANLVEPTPELESLDIYVEVLRSREIPWSLYYVGLAALAASLLLAVVTGTPGFAGLEALDVGVFTATVFGISSVAHHVIGRRTRLGNTEKPPELRRRE
ncbi:transcriptional regulator [Halorubrum ezzemoulense]|uniref:Transcriptional regulator n=1 Tax=Halorubrum ezzemoulense TaxID=337243 RepID=A0A256JNH2_HALEZ|nr:transcriptional regulator [Halorubrum ezzemoulense]MDB9248701.1 transcriptional regulator [Halorubrum ezzemoulense]MDB9258961.1 transcriptional regulator [Halorubrum ezzemoulense]MDB9262460.1 transcriptional regulator [Halorubrum ezzemoulense]MDB9265980.1 transcriptional regulator [Halorubrum ezzemoulense]MDB9269322.1 transcriptional regulator [Halorubrum ezzemoulense]